MTLVKKTIILSKNGAKGYLTVVRVGSSVGIKVVIDYENEELVMGLKIGASELIVETINAAKMEFDVTEIIDFKNSDDVSCIILCGDKVYAEGGSRGRVNVQDIIKHKSIMANKEKDENKFKQISKEVGYEGKGVFQQVKSQNKEADSKSQTKAQTQESRAIEKNQRIEEKIKQPKVMEKTEIHKNAQQEVVSEEEKTNDNKDLEKDKKIQNKKEQVTKKTIEEKSTIDDIKKQDTQEGKLNSEIKSEEKLTENIKTIPKDAKSFYYSVKDKLDELFVMYPRDELLEKIIPSSKWVKINYDKDDYYVAGVLIDDDDRVSHIAYGVPGFEGKAPPKETECICDWLPIKNMERYQGYWLIFQSADTGEILPKD